MPPLSQVQQWITGLLGGVVLALIIGGIRALYRRYRPPVDIWPRVIAPKARLTAPTSHTVFIENKTPEMLFNVVLKFTVEGWDSSAIKVTADGRKNLTPEELSNLMDDYDFVRMDGSDSQGRETIIFTILRLVPKTPQPFVIELPAVGPQEGKTARVTLQKTHHSRTPVEADYPLKPPQQFNIRSNPLFLKREVDQKLLEKYKGGRLTV